MKCKQQACALMALILLIGTLFAVLPSAAVVSGGDTGDAWLNPFEDIKPADWFYEDVQFANENGLFYGTTDTQFSPTVTMNRAMFSSVIARIDGALLDSYVKTSFRDVNLRSWYAASVEWAYQTGVVSGTGNKNFSPDGQVTRQEMCVMLDRYFHLSDLVDIASCPRFADDAAIADWAKNAVYACRMLGIIAGVEEGGELYAYPARSAGRAEAAAILTRFCKLYELPYAPCIKTPVKLAEIDMDGLAAMAQQMTDLREKCRDAGLECPYEDSSIETFNMHVSFLIHDLAENTDDTTENDHSYVARARLRSMNAIYLTTRNALQSYLLGLTVPMQIESYDASTIVVDGNNLVAQYEDGSTEPVYPVGYGHWIDTLSDGLPSFDTLGYHVVQVEVGPWSIIVPRGQGSHEGLLETDPFDISLSTIENSLIPFLQLAKESNVAVCLLLSPHYFPAFICDMYPELKNDESGSTHIEINHPMARRVYEVSLRTMLNAVKDEPALFNFCLTNEPAYAANTTKTDLAAWHTYLAEHFDTVADLNTAIGSSFDSFDTIDMPAGKSDGALFYIYSCFNSELFAGWHAWMTGIIAEYSSLPVCAKISGSQFMAWIHNYGCDVEQYTSFCGIMGNDAFAFYDSNRFAKQMWYAYLSAISDAPIYDSEDHVVHELPGEYDENALARHVYLDMWEGGLNGRSASTMWTWYPLERDSNYGLYGNVVDKPLVMDYACRASLDLSRLHLEADALNDARPTIWVLFSKATMVYDNRGDMPAYTSMRYAYEAACASGEKVGVLTETTLNLLQQGDILIAPACKQVSDAAAAEIADLAKTQTISLVCYNECFVNNEYDMPLPGSVVADINANAHTFSNRVFDDDVVAFSNYLDGQFHFSTSLKTASGRLPNCIYYTTEYNGAVLLQVANYATKGSTGPLTVTYKGTPVTEYRDLLTGKTYSAENGINLGYSECALLCFEP